MKKGRKSPEAWKELYRLALLETDRDKVCARVDEAHSAISLKIDLLASSASSEEYVALKESCVHIEFKYINHMCVNKIVDLTLRHIFSHCFVRFL